MEDLALPSMKPLLTRPTISPTGEQRLRLLRALAGARSPFLLQGKRFFKGSQ